MDGSLFCAQTGVRATSSSVNCASALGSRVRRVPRIAAMKPRGMLMIPGLVSGRAAPPESNVVWRRERPRRRFP